MQSQAETGLYHPEFEHDSCGVGFVARISARPGHDILRMALQALVNLSHRGAVSADAKSGDGAGVLTQLPHKLLQRELSRLGVRGPKGQGDLALGVFFLPYHDLSARQQAQEMVERVVAGYGIPLLAWRPVPVDNSALGEQARATMPFIAHLLVARPEGMDPQAFSRSLYLARKDLETWATRDGVSNFYVPSFSIHSMVYKGMMVAPQLGKFYLDLQDPDFHTSLVVFHQRYSTNTFPAWPLAQPFRFLAHNGEINTLKGNLTWARAREPKMRLQVSQERGRRLEPLCQPGGSDSASLDNVLESLVHGGRSLAHAVAMLVPEAWENIPDLSPALRAFYLYHACVTEPWDGPAALVFSDGLLVGAALDRNGLRPARYKITDDGIVVLGSEVGAVELDDAHVVEKGRLGPGQMIAVDTQAGRLLKNQELKDALAARLPYQEWLDRHLLSLPTHVRQVNGTPVAPTEPDPRLLRAFGYTTEELNLMLAPMATKGEEPTGSMGDDTPLAVLSTRPRLLFSYFKQRFAQVTNPPIDPLREQIVMSLDTYLGAHQSMLDETPDHARLLYLPSPVLTDGELEVLKKLEAPGVRAVVLSCLFPAAEGPECLRLAIERLCQESLQAMEEGATILILSDRGVDANYAPISMLLAVGAVHNHLLRAGKRMNCSLVCETGEAREMHHICCLIGYGASAVNPYLGFAATKKLSAAAHHPENGSEEAIAPYKKIVEKQVLKVMSKMGISTVSGYHGAQLFEAIGLGREVVETCFAGTTSQLGGIGFEGLARETLARHQSGYADGTGGLDDWGYYRFRKNGELHAFNPQMVRALHKSVESGNWKDHQAFLEQVKGLPPVNLRDLMRVKPLGQLVPLEEVEPAQDIVRRFNTGSMSLGALSPEAHETLAIATNRIGSRSNTGEGGEDPRRYRTIINGRDSANSKSKQVASGRFGVTPEYLAMADELEIKMAQGSKPGEGGQLPGHKVVEHIAIIRHTQPGVPLISPPPHHDIYSIEDLAQLIYDLKTVNPRARVAVKLVAESGVGTIAAGVAKAYADVIHVSGHDGGTGASPFSSIKNAGIPWELGLAETQQTLELNNLRGRVLLRTDGGMRSAWDILVAALLGAEEYNFGTSSLIAIGCQMARQCHLNTCPVGIASQDPKLRAKFKGQPEHLIRHFFFIAEELRQMLASMGVRRLDEIIGMSELLEQMELPGHPKANTLDFSPMLCQVDPLNTRPRRRMQERNDRPLDFPLDTILIEKVRSAINGSGPVHFETKIRNVNRTVGARIAGEIAYLVGDKGIPEGAIDITFHGSAGQSFGAFLTPGMRFTLKGEANDYVGKGMCGGELLLRPPVKARFLPHESVIMGNTALYGATGGYLFAAGRAGERFAVRNSGAWAVVEGTGHHCCEYMTGGAVVVLGETGYNFGAGMSGGVAYVWDPQKTLPGKLNGEMVELHLLEDQHDLDLLHALVERHAAATGSLRAQELLRQWDVEVSCFWKVAAKPTVAPPSPREEQQARRDAMLAATRVQQSS